MLGIGAVALLALNVLAFSATSAYAYDNPLDPIFIGDCYQTVSTCGSSPVLYQNCSSKKTSQYCKYTNSHCHACGNEPIFFDPIVGPIVDPGITPEYPGVPVPWDGPNGPGSGKLHP